MDQLLVQEKDERTEDSIIKVKRNPFRLKKELEEIDATMIKDIRNLFRLRKKTIKESISS